MKGQVSIFEIDPIAGYVVTATAILTLIMIILDKVGGLPL